MAGSQNCRIPDGIVVAFAVDYGRAGSPDELVAWGNARGMRDPGSCRWERQPGTFGPDQGPPSLAAAVATEQRGISLGSIAALALILYFVVRR